MHSTTVHTTEFFSFKNKTSFAGPHLFQMFNSKHNHGAQVGQVARPQPTQIPGVIGRPTLDLALWPFLLVVTLLQCLLGTHKEDVLPETGWAQTGCSLGEQQ